MTDYGYRATVRVPSEHWVKMGLANPKLGRDEKKVKILKRMVYMRKDGSFYTHSIGKMRRVEIVRTHQASYRVAWIKSPCD